jgi:hypothetical protein
MSAEAAALAVTFSVGQKYHCTVTIPPPRRGELRSAVFEWMPSVPQRLTEQELQDYRRGRDAAFTELARRSGLQMLLVEI